jgi:antirestriction protein ArdC
MRRNAEWKRRKPANQAAFLHIIPTSRLLKVLNDDPRAIFTAASKAQQATDWMHAQQPHPAPS